MDKAQLLTPRLKVDTVDVDGVGTVTVRGLSRAEMILVFDLEGKRLQQEQRALSFGMVDPAMTEADVAAWQDAASSDEIDRVARKINELSGIGREASKSVVPGDGAEPGD